MSSATWRQVRIRRVPTARLRASQQTVSLEAVLADADLSVCGDPFPHVVVADGTWWLSDGHHRVLRAMLAGERRVWARVLFL